ncbi:MAG: hypothetical protein O4861_23670 [Trichodesmium sp. St16_bin4-tuft]|nr:hypothetical protein [Trichodesmium sp. MAG_R01]MDE5068917.1 hypothetical protein [Trichodesmium sp. St4_bin8_1]MDE5070569.1 hypothetical protein [Trichodesmium sp. St5_bin8]MDE5077140.1 hypothetical protein [Trichodesmium sp. St2_bin6]MDE5101165.1 hypothetical protein [Trichodesmium sp. St16_bin4-tuft]MDE5105115.1 hypothetical protein [Trichodesmium sp. St19_bin2]
MSSYNFITVICYLHKIDDRRFIKQEKIVGRPRKISPILENKLRAELE